MVPGGGRWREAIVQVFKMNNGPSIQLPLKCPTLDAFKQHNQDIAPAEVLNFAACS